MGQHDQLVHLPADTDPHRCCAIAWPSLADVEAWHGHLGAARDAVAELVRTIARFEPVTVLVDDGEADVAARWIDADDLTRDGAAIEIREVARVPQRLRSDGPLGVIDLDGRPCALVPDGPAGETASAIAAAVGLPISGPSWNHGGARVVSDGDLTAIATAGSFGDDPQVLDRFGFERVVWLAAGRSDDPTRAAAGLLAATGPGRVLLQSTTDTGDPDHANAATARTQLELAGLEVMVLDVLPHVECFDTVVEVPYVGGYVANGGVVVPVAGAAGDAAALDAIAAAYPGRQVVGAPGRVLAYGGLGFRDITLPVPAPRI